MRALAAFTSSNWSMLTGVLVSAVLAFFYARGGSAYLLGFVMLVPWLRALDLRRSLASTLLSAYLMSVAFTLAVFWWFGLAIGRYAQLGAATGLVVLLIAAPFFQPQFLVFALVRYAARRPHGAVFTAFAAAAAWVAAEWLLPKLLGDTLGHGLYPSILLRQAADLGGAAGLTFLLLLVNQALAAALAARGEVGNRRQVFKLLGYAAMLPAVLCVYGLVYLSPMSSWSSILSLSEGVDGKKLTENAAPATLRVGLIQSNIANYESQREEKGTHAVVREVLDVHFAMSYDAVVRQRADAVLWSETTYPTTFAHPKSDAGAELDKEILSIINAAGVPFVFGSYDRDAEGEYNAAAFVQPNTGLLGFYRKTRLFPLTEWVPPWLDSAAFRRWLPWTGNWQRGNGARVFPLRLADGREIPVMAMICLDDVDAGLAIDGARLGAQAILTMSNDSWFTDYPQGAALHQAVAAFRSIETRLPQFRVTTNGTSGLIDATGTVLAGGRMGERTLVVGELPVRTQTSTMPRTLMLLWGDWVGRAATIFLLCVFGVAGITFLRGNRPQSTHETVRALGFPAQVAILPFAARLVAGSLRCFARASLLGLAAAFLFIEPLRSNTLAQCRWFAALFLLPELASWCVLLAFRAQAQLEEGELILKRGRQRIRLALSDIAGVELWRIPLPSAGVNLRLSSGSLWPFGVAIMGAHPNPIAFRFALPLSGATAENALPIGWLTEYQNARFSKAQTKLQARLNHPLCKFVLLPLMLAIPAFQLHQHIAYGNAFGEAISFGLKAYAVAFGLWWAAWTIGVTLSAAVLRAVIEAVAAFGLLFRPTQALNDRRILESCGHLLLYLGLPLWLYLQVTGV